MVVCAEDSSRQKDTKRLQEDTRCIKKFPYNPFRLKKKNAHIATSLFFYFKKQIYHKVEKISLKKEKKISNLFIYFFSKVNFTNPVKFFLTKKKLFFFFKINKLKSAISPRLIKQLRRRI